MGGIYKSIIDAAVDLHRVYMMPGWRESRGAVLEFMQARRNEMQIYEDIPRKLQNGIIKWDGGRCGKEPGDVKRD